MNIDDLIRYIENLYDSVEYTDEGKEGLVEVVSGGIYKWHLPMKLMNEELACEYFLKTFLTTFKAKGGRLIWRVKPELVWDNYYEAWENIANGELTYESTTTHYCTVYARLMEIL